MLKKTCEHEWQTALKSYGRWYSCKRCPALGKLEQMSIAEVICTDCENLATTLNERDPGEYYPVCNDHFLGYFS